VVAIFAFSAMPVYAQGQQPDTVKLKADAQNAFNIISSDKLKIQLFCEMAHLGNQLDQAERLHDTKKAVEVSQKMDELEEKLPEYTALVDGLKDVDPNYSQARASTLLTVRAYQRPPCAVATPRALSASLPVHLAECTWRPEGTCDAAKIRRVIGTELF
jgi:hypothetical protein